MIRIFSAHSAEGGSTQSFINLTNALNEGGYEAIFYGRHAFHTARCRGEQLRELSPDFSGRSLRQWLMSLGRGPQTPREWWTRLCSQMKAEDSVIIHFLRSIPFRPRVKRFVLSCHEQQSFSLSRVDPLVFDAVHFVSEHQREWQFAQNPVLRRVPSFIVGNIYDKGLRANSWSRAYKVGGVIGTIFPPKAVDEAIKWAIADGCRKVLVYGNVADRSYLKFLHAEFEREVARGIVQFRGHVEDKQAMYDSFSDLYLCSHYECLPSVVGEALLTKKKIHIPEGRPYQNARYWLDGSEVLSVWKRELAL